MPITIHKQLAPSWFKLDEADPSTAEFHLRPLTQLQFHGAMQHCGMNEFNRSSITQAGIDHVLQHGLIGWRNVIDADGNELECKRSNFENLPFNVLNTLTWQILGATRLTDDQKKS